MKKKIFFCVSKHAGYLANNIIWGSSNFYVVKLKHNFKYKDKNKQIGHSKIII